MTAPAVPLQHSDDPLEALKALKQSRAPQSSDPLEELKALRAQGPGAVSRGFSKAGEGLLNTVLHPIDTAAGMIEGPIRSAFRAVVSPGVGEARPDPRLSKGGNSSGAPIDRQPYDAEHGAITPRERTVSGIQSVVNAAAPSAFSGVKNALGGKAAGTAAGLAAVGAAGGAAYNPDDPGAGAIAGGIATPIVGGVAGTFGGAALKGTGKLLDLNTKRLQVKRAPTLGADAVAREADIAKTDAKNYGQAEREGAEFSGTTPRALTDELNAPDIRPYVDMLLKTRQFAHADDATLTREAYKLMSSQQGGLEHRLALNGYDAPLDLENKNIGAAKGALSAGAEQVMPSFPHAVEEHAVRESAAELSERGGDDAKRIMYERSLPGRKQKTQSEEAVLRDIGRMSPEDASNYQTGVLGRGKEGVKFHAPNATSTSIAANIVQPLTRLNRLAPVIDALDQRQGRGPTLGRKMMNPQTTEQLFRMLGLTLPSELTSP